QQMDLADYKGKALVIVNTASKCGFTPQFAGLEELYLKYKDRGLVVLGFPCNQFMGQDPGNDQEIQEFCSLHYGVTFPMLSKIEVNGETADPLYKFLKSQKSFGGFNFKHPIGKKLDEILSKEDAGYNKKSAIKWNFTKFVIGKDGEVLKRFEPTTEPKDMQDFIESIL
ncbi:MAG: glutathione peroxidase, partial [Christensenellaceae bacterium]